MAKEEASTPSKSEKPSSPPQEQGNMHPYPNWAAVQAYYGSGVNVPPPYFNSAVASGHPPHPYMWGTPPHLMSPYGTPYPAMFSPGGVYAHPSFVGSSSQGLANSSCPVASEDMAPTPLKVATPAKSSSSKDKKLVKKLKGLNGSAVSVGNENSGSSAASHSEDCGTEGSSHASGDNKTERGEKVQRKRSSGAMPSTGKNAHAVKVYGGEASATSSIVPPVTMVPASIVGKPVGIVPSLISGMAGKLAATSPQVPEVLSQNDLASVPLTKDERELKRERRKQSNRESARRSRLRKQAEAEELAEEVESLSAENMTLRSEIDQFKEDSEKLRLENAALMEQLKNIHQEGAVEVVSNITESQQGHAVTTENFLSRVESSLSNIKGTQREIETNDQSNSGSKLHQLLESSPRADAVAAS